MQDIYFEENYGKLYERMEHGRTVVWRHNGEAGSVRHMFLLRGIPGVEGWHDIVTPYGYGGPMMEAVNPGFDKRQLAEAFGREFGRYCQENKIVSEFVRFHPMVGNGVDFAPVYHSVLDRYTVGTDLKAHEDSFAEEFTKGCRKNIRQALKRGVSWRVTPKPDNLESFKEIYYSTMDRNGASDFYYFDDGYFHDCEKYFRDHLVYVEAVYGGKPIAAGMYFTYGKTIHIHLSGTLSEYLFLSPAYILRHAMLAWGEENGYEMIHHGGGRTSREDDSLYLFKKQFGRNTRFPFYVGRKVWDREMYGRLCEGRGMSADSKGYFPAYRRSIFTVG